MPQEALIAIVGAGPIGLEMAIALKRAGISYIQFDKGQAAQAISNFPPETHFFSSNERISIAGIPIQTLDQQKCTREQYLAYIRSVIMQYNLTIHSYEDVFYIEKLKDGFILQTKTMKEESSYHARFVILGTGGTSFPRMLGIRGERLDHVSTKMEDPHKYFQKEVLIVGSKNSAVETALRCFQAGAKVSIVLRSEQFDPHHVKYWLLPELLGRIERKEIHCYYSSEVIEIQLDRVILQSKTEAKKIEAPADFVIKAIGFQADMKLFKQLGVQLLPEQEMPMHNEETMETNIPEVFVLGTAVGGTQNKYRVFIENTHIHVEKILKTLCKRLNIKNYPGINEGVQFKPIRTTSLEE